MSRVRLQAGDVVVELEPALGGSVVRFEIGGAPLFRPAPESANDVLLTGCFPLVPFVNRVRDGVVRFRGREIRLSPNLPPQKHPLHGQGWRSAWTVERADERSAELLFRHETGEWPWAYEARQRFAVEERGLTVVLECRNTSATAMPCGLGQHPYFPCDAETVLDAAVTHVWTVDEEIMPVERAPATGLYDLRERRIAGADLDNGYDGWSGRAVITWPGMARLTMSADAPRFQVYAPPTGEVFAAEPVTNANDAISRPESEWAELGLVMLEPGQSTALEVRFEAERL